VLSVLWFTDSDYLPLVIFNFFLCGCSSAWSRYL